MSANAKAPVHIHDLNATLLHIMGIDHLTLTYRSQGRDFRLTDVHGNVVKGVLAQSSRAARLLVGVAVY